MKKIFYLFLLGVSLISCQLNDYNDGYQLVILPVAEVEMQTAFAKDSLTNIPVKYLRPSNCHFFEDFYYEKNGFTRFVAIYCSKLNKDNCQSFQNDTIEVPLKFRPTELGTYQFKFWTGVNAQGQDVYQDYEVEVNH
jgi:hypothetical protein